MNIADVVGNESAPAVENPGLYQVDDAPRYDGLFCEQYLEKPVISGDYEMSITPTACTIKGIPVIDDF